MSSPIPGEARPKLARKTRLRFDRHTGKHWLIFPERGLLLSASAAQIAALCTGDKTLDAITAELQASAQGANREQIAQDVQDFLVALRDRALLEFL